MDPWSTGSGKLVDANRPIGHEPGRLPYGSDRGMDRGAETDQGARRLTELVLPLAHVREV